MPNLKNAIKALRQNNVRAERNKSVKANIEYMRRQFRKLVEDKKIEEAQKLLSSLTKELDKAVTKHVFKKNTVARVKSRATIKLNALKK